MRENMITLDKSELLNSLQTVSRAANSKSTMNILSCVLLNATGSTIELETTNMEISIRTSIPCITEKGKICIDVKQLTDIVKKMPEGDINIDFDKMFLVTLSAGKKIKFSLQGQDPETFPIYKEQEGDELTLKASDLKDAVTGVAFCASMSDTNKLMKGINVRVKEGKVIFTALDGHRIAIREKNMSEVSKEYNVTIPASELNDVLKVLPNCEMKMIINDVNVTLIADETVVTMRLLEGNYYKVDQMISNDYETFVTLSTHELYDAVDRASLLLNDAEKKPIIMSITESGIRLIAKAGKGNAEEDIEVERKEGKDLKIGFNPKFIMDMLKAISDEKINFRLNNAKSPAIVSANDKSYTYLVLPVNFTEAA